MVVRRTKRGYALRYNISEIPVVGIKASGVKAINLKDDVVVSMNVFDEADYITVITENGTGKSTLIKEILNLDKSYMINGYEVDVKFLKEKKKPLLFPLLQKNHQPQSGFLKWYRPDFPPQKRR